MVHENFRWQPWYRKIKELQIAGAIGEFTHIHVLTRFGDGWGEQAYLDRQPFFRDYPRLLIYETGVHFIDTFRFLLGEVKEVYAHLRRLNPVIRGEDAGQLFLCFESGATAIWDANRYNETEAPNPRYTFGEIRVDATGGHLTMDSEANIRVKKLGEPAWNPDYARENRNFAGDCVYALQRHFVDCMLSGREFESSGREYLKTLEVVFCSLCIFSVAVHLGNLNLIEKMEFSSASESKDPMHHVLLSILATLLSSVRSRCRSPIIDPNKSCYVQCVHIGDEGHRVVELRQSFQRSTPLEGTDIAWRG
jgi:hypothetical protein